MKELRAPLGDVVKTRSFDGMPYVPVETIRKRLDDVIGREHYNETYETTVETARDTVAIMAKGRIEVLSDDFEIVFVKEAGGGKTVIFPKIKKKDDRGVEIEVPGTETNEFANAVASACQDAFKRICTSKFGIGEMELAGAKPTKKGGEEKIVMFNANVAYNNGKYFFAPVTVDGAENKLAVFSKELATFQAGIPQGTPAGTAFKMLVKPGTDKQGNKQLVFQAFC